MREMERILKEKGSKLILDRLCEAVKTMSRLNYTLGSVILPSTEEFLQTIFDEQGTYKNVHDLENRPLEFEVVLNDGNEAIWMVPIRETPYLCSVWMSNDYSSELPLWQKTHLFSPLRHPDKN